MKHFGLSVLKNKSYVFVDKMTCRSVCVKANHGKVVRTKQLAASEI